MKVAKQKSTGKYINDFQSLATPAGLVNNAVKSGIPVNDVEVEDVTEQVFSGLAQSVNAGAIAALEAERIVQVAEEAALIQKLKINFGFSDKELKILPLALNKLK